MKKKIILFLSVLLVVLFVTGCSTTTNPEALEKSNEVANEIAKNMGEYKLPDGYDLSYPDSKDTSRFYLTSTTEQKNELRAEYQISNKEAKLVAFRVDDNKYLLYFLIGVIILVIGFVIGVFVERNS